MNWLDIVIIVVIAVPAFLGLRTGIIKTCLSLAGLILGVILAGRYYIPFAEQLSSFTPGVAKIVAFALIMIGVMAIALVLSRLLERAVSMILLGWVNRLGGALFGFLIGAILCGALLATWVKFIGPASAIVESGLALILVDYFPLVLALLPEEFKAIRSFFQ